MWIAKFVDAVKELVRGLDDESSPADIKKTKDRIYAVIDQIAIILQETEKADGTLKALDGEQKKLMDSISLELASTSLSLSLAIAEETRLPASPIYIQKINAFLSILP